MFKLDHDAIGRILMSDMRGPVSKLAAQVASRVDVGGVAAPVTVADYSTDRAISVVAIAHPAGLAIQAKHGALTRAAAACGFEVTSR